MGGGTSKFEATDWTRASGGLTQTEETVDGALPTSRYQTFHLIKRSLTMNQREFDIVGTNTNNNNNTTTATNGSSPNGNHNQNPVILYTTRAVPGTLAWFDVWRPSTTSKNEEGGLELLLRVRSDLARRTWVVFRYQTPCFPGQRPAGNIEDAAPGRDNESRLPSSELWYKSACITISWSRYVAVVARYGPPSIEYLFHLEPSVDDMTIDGDGSEELRHTGETKTRWTIDDEQQNKEQDSRPSIVRTISSDSHDELLTAAEMVAFRRRQETRTSIADSSSSSQSSESLPETAGRSITISKKTSSAEKAKQILSKAVDSCSSNCGPSSSKNYSSPDSSWHDPSSFDLRATRALLAAQGTPSGDGEMNLSNPAITMTTTPSDLTRYVSSRLFGSSFPTTNGNDQQEDEGTTSIQPPLDWPAQEIRRKAAYRRAMQGVIDLDGPLLECQEIYNKIVGNHQTALIAKDRVKRLLQWDVQQAQQQDEDKHEDTSTTLDSNNINPFLLALQEEDRSQQSSQLSVEEQDDLSTAVAERSHISLPSKPPLTLDSPAPLGGTESYQNELEASLSDIMEKQRQQNSTANSIKSWFGYGSGGPPSSKERHPWSPNSRKDGAKQKETEWEQTETALAGLPLEELVAAAPIKPDRVDNPSEDFVPPAVTMSPLSFNQQEALPNQEEAQQGDSKKLPPSSTNFSSNKTSPEPLVGYWSWKNSVTVHKVELHLAKDSDLALHVVLAIICNQVRSERNALAMGV